MSASPGSLSSGSASMHRSARSRAWAITSASSSTRSRRRLDRLPDWLAPSTSPSRRWSRSTSASTKPSRVAATASSRSRARLPRLRGGQQQADPGVGAAADPAAQLVQLGDAEPVGVADHHHRGVGHVDPHLDHRGGDQDVGLPAGEPAHHRVLLLAGQLTVQQLDPAARPAGRRPARRTGPRPRWRAADPPRRRPGPHRRPGRASSAAEIRAQTTYACRPAADLLADPLPGPVDPARLAAGVDHDGADVGPAGRHLPQRGGLQVAEHRHRHRPRDRGGRHHQHVRSGGRPWR